MRRTIEYWFKRGAFYFGGDQPYVSWAERLRSSVGALLGLLLVFAVAKLLGELTGIDEWLMASLGAMLCWFLPCLGAQWLSHGP